MARIMIPLHFTQAFSFCFLLLQPHCYQCVTTVCLGEQNTSIYHISLKSNLTDKKYLFLNDTYTHKYHNKTFKANHYNSQWLVGFLQA